METGGLILSNVWEANNARLLREHSCTRAFFRDGPGNLERPAIRTFIIHLPVKLAVLAARIQHGE
jgi:hypothetical protein